MICPKLKDKTEILDDDSFKNEENKNKTYNFDKKTLLKLCNIISIVLPMTMILLYFIFDIPLVIGIIVCGLCYILASLDDDKTNKLSVTGRVISCCNGAYLILEFLLYIFSYFLGL